MNATSLTKEEATALATALKQLVIRDRTGELGVLHGMDRFVTTNCCLKKTDRSALDSAARKLGLANGVPVTAK